MALCDALYSFNLFFIVLPEDTDFTSFNASKIAASDYDTSRKKFWAHTAAYDAPDKQ